jgi:O-antigen/teichoic acid export membrane protein
MKLKDKVVQSVKWMFIAQICTQIVRTMVTIMVIRDFEAREMTYVALSQSIFGFFELFSTLRLSATVIRKKEVIKEDLQNVFGLILLVNVVLMILVFGGAERFSEFYNTPEIANILKLTSLTFLLVAVGYVPGVLLMKDMRFKLLSVIQMAAGLGGALTAYLGAKNGLGYWSLVWGGISISVISTVLKICFSPVILWPKLDWKATLDNLTFGGLVVGQSIAWYAFVTMDVVIAGKFWSAEALGIYALAVQVVSMPLNRTLPLIKSVALPAFSRSMIDNRSQLESHTVKGLKLSLMLSVPMFWGAAATAAVLVPIFLGEKWLTVIWPMALLAMAAPFRFLTELFGPAVIVAGHPKALFRNEVMVSLIMQMFYVIVILKSENPAFLATVWTLVYPVLALISARRYCRYLQIRFMAVARGIFPVIISGLIMLGVVLPLTYSLLDTMNHIALLALAVATGVFTYGASLFVIDRAVLFEVMALARGPKK